jgi:membrane-associated protease RseP (regulator of RpoE activity)
MSGDAIALLVFLLGLSVFLLKTRHRLKTVSFLAVFYFCIYRTKLGMRLMEHWARRHERLLRNAGHMMIPVGFLGMMVMLEELVRGVLLLLKNGHALSVGVVLPIQAKGVFYVPFLYWIIAVLFIMIVHELGHGLIARAYRVRVKSTGFAFLGALVPVIPGAFVEIDEKHLARQPRFTQLSIFAAGPFVNIVFGALFWLLLLVLQPAANGLFVSDGMSILAIDDNSPAALTGLAVGDVITAINAAPITSVAAFDKAFLGKKPGDRVTITTQTNSKEAILQGTSEGYLGVTVEEARHLKDSVIASHGWLLPSAFSWLVELVSWLFVLNLGVGLFNLVPLGPIDGGRMFHTALQRVVHHRHARTVWHAVSAVVLVIIAGTLLSAFV